MSTQKCKRCLQEKDLSDFSEKQGKHELVVRYDSVCKCCRKSERKKRLLKNGSVKEASTLRDVTPQIKSIPSQKMKREIPKEVIESVMGVDHIGLNSVYCDLLNEFVHLLRSEMAKMRGVTNVYIKKIK